MRHPTLEQLGKYQEGTIGIFKSGHIERHIAKCTECAKKLKELQDGDQLAEELKSSLKVFSRQEEMSKDPTFLGISKIFGPPEHGISST